MIGVISKENEIAVVKEFFQLFKTPWEFYKDNREYDVVFISRDKMIDKINAKVLFIFGSETTQFDNNMGVSLSTNHNINTLSFGKISLPIYARMSAFKNVSESDIFLEVESEVIGLKIQEHNQIIVRIGYNLFEEVDYLLSEGQPTENASSPTLEIHISILRKLITNAGIPLIEIPPIPADYDFITCLTHDVDFIKICNHFFDHSMWGFVYRGLFGSLKDLLKGKMSFFRVLQNWKAILLLPFVYMGFADDFWFQFDRYLEIEKGLESTFFFIPFKNRIGDKNLCSNAFQRATKYDITDIKEVARKLIKRGNEVGSHGIDAWHSNDKGYRELKRISEITGKSEVGVRMHWLLYNKQTFQILEKAGYHYDSTFGYNETIGYRGGTTQVFRPIMVKNLLELPMHIQDTALFYPRRMDLSEKQALNLCEKLINNASIYGGVLTINWHQRSLAPERLWGDFYLRLLEKLQVARAWFASGDQVVEWFRKRRAFFFDKVQFTENKLQLSLRSGEVDIQPPLMIRIYRPAIQKLVNNDLSIHMGNYFDISWSGEREIEISI